MIALRQDWSDDVQALLESLAMLGARDGETTATDFWRDEDLDVGIDDQADPRALTAETLAIRDEEVHRLRLAQKDAELSRWKPLLILGVGQAWPITNDPDGRCGVCHGRRLERTTFCLWCGRSGVDGMLERVPKKTVRHAYRPGRLPGGKGGEPAPKPVKPAEPKRTGKKRKPKPSYFQIMAPKPAPAESAWRAELDAMKAAAKTT